MRYVEISNDHEEQALVTDLETAHQVLDVMFTAFDEEGMHFRLLEMDLIEYDKLPNASDDPNVGNLLKKVLKEGCDDETE